jgi:hypothetical protein
MYTVFFVEFLTRDHLWDLGVNGRVNCSVIFGQVLVQAVLNAITNLRVS